MKVLKGMLKKGKLELVTADIARSAIKRLTIAERTDEHEDNEAMKRRKMLFFNKLATLTVRNSVIAVVTVTTV